jgi:uncharacterized protein
MLARLLNDQPQLVGSRTLLAWSELFLSYMRTLDDQFDMGHRVDHTLRVTKTAVEMAKREGAALNIVIPAALLHDTMPIGKFDKDRAISSALSAKRSIELLKGWDYPANYLPSIEHAILAHSFSANVKPETIEAKVVQDADRLDALGAIGIARTMAAGFKQGNPLYHFDEPFPRIRAANDHTNVVDHFYIKLFRLPDLLNTSAAKTEAVRRITCMEMFLQELAHEVGDEFMSYRDYCRSLSTV